jgi:hypothetical protein
MTAAATYTGESPKSEICYPKSGILVRTKTTAAATYIGKSPKSEI